VKNEDLTLLPISLTPDSGENSQEVLELLKQSKNMTGGRIGELALLGRRKLGTEWVFLKKVKVLFRNKLKLVGNKNS
jgi:hypothetical protein